jgi:Domain of unknown function (DUF4173)
MTPSPAIDSASEVPAATTVRLRMRYGARVLGLALVMGVLSRWALGGAMGLGFFVWVTALVCAFALAGGREALQQARASRTWAIAAIFFAGWVVVRDSSELTFFNVVTALGLLALAARDTVNAPKRTRLFDFPGGVRQATVGSVLALGSLRGELLHQAQRVRAGAPGSTAAVVRGLLLAAPVLCVLTALLMSGDSRFGQLLQGLTASLPQAALTGADWGFSSSMAATGVAGFLAYALRRRVVETEAQPGAPMRRVGAIEGLVVLGSVVLLFGAFLGMQAAWLFLQDPSARGTGLTYAAWARGGFAELSVVAVITWGLVELGQRRVDAQGRADLAVRAASSMVLVQAVVLLISAHQRLALYDEVYGFTVTRIFAHAGITFLGLGLVVRLVTLWVARASTANLVVASALGVLAGLNALNPDAFVVKANVARPQDGTVAVDYLYLSRLSADAAPLLAELSNATKAPLFRYGCQFKRSWFSVAGFNLARSRARALDLPCLGDENSRVDFDY